MTYKGFEIVAECITERAEYSLNDEGELVGNATQKWYECDYREGK
jgi:hypothetical protein